MTNPHINPSARPRNQATPWMIAMGLGVAAIFGLILLGNYARENVEATNSPAVTATPAPATQRPAPAPETTTGQRARPAQPER